MRLDKPSFEVYYGKYIKMCIRDRLRALPLKPTKGSAFGNRKPLKRLERNFKCLRTVSYTQLDVYKRQYLLFADLAGQRSIPSSNVVEETLVDEVMTRTSCPSEIRLFPVCLLYTSRCV